PEPLGQPPALLLEAERGDRDLADAPRRAHGPLAAALLRRGRGTGNAPARESHAPKESPNASGNAPSRFDRPRDNVGGRCDRPRDRATRGRGELSAPADVVESGERFDLVRADRQHALAVDLKDAEGRA